MTKKLKVGIIFRSCLKKTRTILTYYRYIDLKYGKLRLKRKFYMANDEHNISYKGDCVLFKECRPISSKKRWKVVTIIKI